jgi:hypothetical protein
MDSKTKGASVSLSWKSRQVPEQYWGYSLQAVRFLHLLLEARPGAVVSLEVFEDVGCQNLNGTVLASQNKTGLVKNPISDRALELWKTFGNWLDAIDAGILDTAHTVFELYVARRRESGIAMTFHNASNAIEAARVIESARDAMWGPAPRRLKRSRIPKTLGERVDRVLGPTGTRLNELVRNFSLTFASKDPLADLRTPIVNKWVRAESVDIIIKHAHGWIKERLDSLIQARRPAAIAADEFTKEMIAFLPRCDFRQILTSVAGPPSKAEVEAQAVRTYVRQLEIIEASDEDKIQAINEYLRACVQRTQLSKAGIVHEESFDDYEKALSSFWRNKKRQNALTHTDLSAVQHGQLLLSDCCLKEQKLQGLEVPSFFTPGSYHALSEEQEIGWHPDYKAKIEENGRS